MDKLFKAAIAFWVGYFLYIQIPFPTELDEYLYSPAMALLIAASVIAVPLTMIALDLVSLIKKK